MTALVDSEADANIGATDDGQNPEYIEAPGDASGSDFEDVDTDGEDPEGKPVRLSKSQKKALAKARYREWRREKRHRNRRETRKREQQARSELLSGMTEEERSAFFLREKQMAEEKKLQQQAFIQDAYENGMPICINCTFHEFMNEKMQESKSLARQIAGMYSKIKKNEAKVKLIITGMSKDTVLYKHMQFFNVDAWKVHIHSQNYWELFDTQNVVVLTPDAEECIEEVEHDKVYIIGGLVDVNVKKKTTLTQAKERGVTAMALPIKKYFPNCKKRVLNVCAVFEILIMRANNSTWEEAFQTWIPTRARTDDTKQLTE
ncbi:predicted protein, putative [Babesia bigemina]|uniref:tRNA (guanine(9)-N(1))-methyltransferase n=1 Tax=Babesia bigemina TaxID=5866 RepID=A0A061D496_BABBI|nr:predicted protein, putative [Babesia bigemina]CDR94867.1 predicted protein, putative [Babesia bigemina]|eukprot:XP_012767053.1 predicted protein, putative [Babesia bigemina]